MTLNDYQQAAHFTSRNTAIGNCLLSYPVLKLNGEAGEVAEKLGKIHRDSQGEISNVDNLALMRELGDVLWYLAEICTQLNIDFDVVAEMNIDKLADRLNRGVIGGSGDDR